MPNPHAEQDAADVTLVSVHNFRDVAGHGMTTPDGPMRRRYFYRSNVVAPGGDDLDTLHALGLRRIIDLRTAKETAQHPDAEIDGAEYVHVDVLGDATSAATILGYDGDATPETARRSLRETYRNFVVDESYRRRLTPVFEALASSPGPVVVHCTAGKDRTGFVAAALQRLAGASAEDVMANYMETNDRSRGWVAELTELFHARVPDRADALVELLLVREEYLDAAFRSVDEQFGSTADYLRNGLGLDAEVVTGLRRALLAAD